MKLEDLSTDSSAEFVAFRKERRNVLLSQRMIPLLIIVAIFKPLAQAECSQSRLNEAIAHKAVAVDMSILNNMKVGFTLNSSVLDDWAKMGDKQKKKLRNVAIFNLIQAAAVAPLLPVIKGSINLPRGMASLSTAQAQAMYKMLEKNGIDDPILEKLISYASAVKDKPKDAEVGVEIFDRLSTMTQAGLSAFGEDKMEILAPVAQLGLILMGPAYAGYATALSAGSDTLTLIQAGLEYSKQSGQTGWLTSANEAGLVQLKARTAKLQTDLKRFRTAKQQLSSCEARKIQSVPGSNRPDGSLCADLQKVVDARRKSIDQDQGMVSVGCAQAADCITVWSRLLKQEQDELLGEEKQLEGCRAQ
jgi:hypothetical protein